MGLLTREGPPDWHPAPPQLRRAAAAAADHAATRGWDISALGLGFSLRQPDVSSTLVGMFTREMVDENINTALRVLGTAEAAAEESQVLAEVADILAAVRNLTWPSGRPLPSQGQPGTQPADA
ncbi:hypothetical protein Vretifemale_5389 [Volvox reticuliferus]|uniref:NADP-dependent oxidoreductase domain-containing protein n=1 Tax=Volvox reticuliferus TaxID=1737510 RepID=A0A8J4FHR8_9CHLO|nr:hypothetical protein Vretifemale_5389 [Volvox reticuliferus]